MDSNEIKNVIKWLGVRFGGFNLTESVLNELTADYQLHVKTTDPPPEIRYLNCTFFIEYDKTIDRCSVCDKPRFLH